MASALAVATAAPASAHTLSGPKPTNYRASIVSVTPAARGVSIRVVDLGAKLELTNRSTEPTSSCSATRASSTCASVRPGSTRTCIRAPRTSTRSLKGGVIPDGVDTKPDAAPQWRKISNGHSARWHDHRAHRMQPGLPPLVASDPGPSTTSASITSSSSTTVRRATPRSRSTGFRGRAACRGSPSSPCRSCSVSIAALIARLWRALALLVGVLVIVDAAHSIAYEIARPGSNLDEGGAVRRRHVRVHPGVARGRADGRRTVAPAAGSAVRRDLRRPDDCTRRWCVGPAVAVALGAADGGTAMC